MVVEMETSGLSEVVLTRTVEGQRALVYADTELNAAERRLLAAANGFTSLEVLASLGLEADDDIVVGLESRRLVSVVRRPS